MTPMLGFSLSRARDMVPSLEVIVLSGNLGPLVFLGNLGRWGPLQIPGEISDRLSLGGWAQHSPPPRVPVILDARPCGVRLLQAPV